MILIKYKPFGFDNERVISHQKLKKYWVAKAPMKLYILGKISNFQSVIAQRLSGILLSNVQR